jgi:hypothetical protein
MITTADTYLKFLQQPSSLNEAELEQVRSLTKRFGYLQSAWTLRWLNATDTHEKQEALHRAAALTYDRTILLQLQKDPSIEIDTAVLDTKALQLIEESEPLEDHELEGVTLSENRVAQFVTDAKSGFDMDLDEIQITPRIPVPETLNFEIDGSIEQKDVPPQSTQKTFADWMKLMVSGNAEGLTEHHIENQDKQRKFDMLDKFIQDKPKIKADPSFDSEFEVDDTIYFDYKEMATETLAQLLFNQKKYGKAIKAYKALMVKIPEKSSFFADQIRKAKALKAKE